MLENFSKFKRWPLPFRIQKHDDAMGFIVLINDQPVADEDGNPVVWKYSEINEQFRRSMSKLARVNIQTKV